MDRTAHGGTVRTAASAGTTSAAARAPGAAARLPAAATVPAARTARRRPPTARAVPAARAADRARRRERGSASIEFLGFLPVLLLVALAGVQLGLIAYVGSQAGTAARAAARTDDAGAGTASVSGWLRGRTSVGLSPGGDRVTATVTINVPSVLPGVSLFGPVVRRATMPQDGAP